jgi:type I restriction enzyme S subunit
VKTGAYPAYKQSGVEWLGDVPKQWEVKRLKYSASINDEALPETTPPEFELNYVDIGNVDSAEGITAQEQLTFDTAPSRARRIVRDGDTIVSTVRTYLRAIAPIRNPESNFIVSTGFAVVRPRKVDAHFLSYALRESSFIENVVARSVGVSYPAINASEVGSIAIPLPRPDEQRAIADFLDRETARLDTLVEKKRKLIEKLKKKRTALISRTVTRGLNANAKLKPSGVEWLGDIPEHWDVKRLRYAAIRIQTGSTPPTVEEKYYEDGSVPWFGPGSFGDAIILTQPVKLLSSDAIKDGAARLFRKGATMVVTIGATLGKVSSIEKDASCNQQITVIEVNRRDVHPRFITYQLKRLEQTLRSVAPSATLPILSQGEIARLFVAIPKVEEQHAIADYLDRETAKIDKMVEKVEAAIEKLQEYRTALITAAVTGKIDVRTVNRSL